MISKTDFHRQIWSKIEEIEPKKTKAIKQASDIYDMREVGYWTGYIDALRNLIDPKKST